MISKRYDTRQIVLTGKIGVGKSTVVKKVINDFPGKVGGFYTQKIVSDNAYEGLEIFSFSFQKKLAAHIKLTSQLKFRNWYVDLSVFEEFASQLLATAINTADLIVMDELGLIEKAAPGFVKQVQKCFASPVSILATVQQRAFDFWQEEIGKFPKVVTVTEPNRDSLPSLIKSWLCR